MKARELMLCDWVINHGKKVRVTYLDAYYDLIETEPVDKYDAGERVSDIEPVPLTEEILKANGFIKTNEDAWDAYIKRVRECGTFCIYVNLTFSEIEISKVDNAGTDCEECDYASDIYLGHALSVHELQHALRLCGLRELADNFKVE